MRTARKAWASALRGGRAVPRGEDGGGDGVIAGEVSCAGGDPGLDIPGLDTTLCASQTGLAWPRPGRALGDRRTRRGLRALAPGESARAREAGANRRGGDDWSLRGDPLPRGDPSPGATTRRPAAGDGGDRHGDEVTCGFFSPATPARLRGWTGGDCGGLP